MKPNEVVIPLNVNLDQVNLIITGLGKLQYELVADLVNAVRNKAIETLKAAEAEELAAADAGKVPFPADPTEGN